MSTLPDWLRRAIRTLAQVAVVEAVIQVLLAFGVPITPVQHTAILGLATPVVSAIQNALEDKGVVPALGKAPAPDGERPVPPIT
ncbi:MAG TPA: hypothetical protein VF041_23110 [Gemmatimonadaceae bacterium]